MEPIKEESESPVSPSSISESDAATNAEESGDSSQHWIITMVTVTPSSTKLSWQQWLLSVLSRHCNGDSCQHWIVSKDKSSLVLELNKSIYIFWPLKIVDII